MKLNGISVLLLETAKRWYTHNVSVYAAALAYYTIFAIAPMFIFLISIIGAVFSQNDAREWLFHSTEPFVGPQVMRALRNLLHNIQDPPTTVIATGLGLLTFFFGTTRIVSHLKFTFDAIWEVTPKPVGFWKMFVNRLLIFLIVIAVGFLLVLLAVAGAALTGAGDYLHEVAPYLEPILKISDFLITMCVGTLMFAVIFKYFPDAVIFWRNVWLGSVITAFLFFIGKKVLGLYFSMGAVKSAHGAAGSLVVIILWIYYSAQILFFGAEFIQVYVKRYGSASQR